MTYKNRHVLLWLPILILAGTLAACGNSSATSAASAASAVSGSPAAAADTIIITNFMFQPMTLTVSPDAVVTVRNEDSATHTLTDEADPGLFSTGDVSPGQARTFRAPGKPGSYPFFCTIHQFMTGTLVVR